MIEVLVNIVQYGGRAFILTLFTGKMTERFHFQKKQTTRWILGLLYVLIQLILEYAPFIKQILYENERRMIYSSQSLGRILVSVIFALTLFYILYDAERLQVIYRVSTFYAVLDLAGFVLHSFFVFLLNKIINMLMYLYIDRSVITLDTYEVLLEIIGNIWEILYISATLLLMAGILKKIRQYIGIIDYQIQHSEWLFSLVPSITGFVFCMFVRCMMFEQSNQNIYYLLEEHQESNFLIPGMALLCLTSIILCMKMLRKLMEDNKERVEIQVYQSKIIEMEEHIADIESLYDGIRGVRHDVKNYIADIEALLVGAEHSSEKENEMKQYLFSLLKSVDDLDLKHHTGNSVTDVIIQRYTKNSNCNSIAIESNFCYPIDKNIDAFDLAIILNNGLSNAVEACLHVSEQNRFIEITSYMRQNMYFIDIRNSCDSSMIQVEHGKLKSHKKEKDKHGLGIKNMIRCAEKYYGKVEYKILADSFQVVIMLQMNLH